MEQSQIAEVFIDVFLAVAVTIAKASYLQQWPKRQVNNFNLACMTGAVWAKRGERDISIFSKQRENFSLSLVSRCARNIAFAQLGS